MNNLEAFKTIRTFILDVDGVLTNGNLLVMENGRIVRKLNHRDDFAIKKAVEAGYRIVVLTGGAGEGIVQHLKALGVIDIYTRVGDKVEAYNEIIDLYSLDENNILYMGDDWPDYPTMRRVGFPACPADAIPEIIKISKYISPYQGGEGCVRDVIEKVLRLNDNWMTP